MIRRLQHLRLKGYRGFRTSADVPLNADVVLICGENGSGKSSILSGIEYALTGEVPELKTLTSDYPRSLTHVAFSGTGEAVVDALLHDGASARFGTPNSRSLSGNALRHFREHCYLPQSRLTRLLSRYRGRDDDSIEEGLSKFIRELLGLGLLDAITDGLHEAGDVRRLRGVVAEYDELRLELHRLKDTFSQLEGELAEAKARTNESVDGLRSLPSDVRQGLFDVEEPDAAVFHALLNELRAKDAATGKEGALKRLRTAEVALHKAATMLGEPPEGVEDPSSIRDKLGALRTEREDLSRSLERVVEHGFSLWPDHPEVPDGVLERFRVVEQLNQEEIQELKDEILVVRRVMDIVAELEKRRDERNARLEELTDSAPQELTREEQWVETLRRVLSQVDNELCPVCGRDFSEVGKESLRNHVAQELARLESEVSESASRMRARLATEAELGEVEMELAVVRERFAGLRTLEQLERLLERQQALEEAVVSHAPARDECHAIDVRIDAVSDMLERSERWYEERVSALSGLKELAKELDLEEWDVMPPSQLLKRAALGVEALREDVLKGDEERQQLIRQLEETLERALTLQDLLQRQARRRAQVRRLQDAAHRISEIAESARGVRDLVAEVKADLIREVFTERLNELWSDLFSRMVRNEWFLPRLDVEPLQRGHLRSSMRAFTPDEDTEAFDQLESVLSAGNVNTAALSLFLAFTLIQRPINRVLILDDPVQSMDDLHAVELAHVLRLVSRQTDRQLIIAVHEEALLEYLEVELGPTTEDQELLTIRVWKEGDSSFVEPTRRTWRDDRLRVPA